MKRLALIIIMISCLMVAVAHGESPLDKHSGIPLPETLGKFKRTKVIDNESENPGLGTTVYYNTPGLKATLYIYNMGKKSIADGIDSPFIKDSFEGAKNDVKEAARLGYYKLTSGMSSRSSYLILESKSVPVLAAEFSYQDKGQEFLSWLYMTGYKNQIIKLRVSHFKADKDLADPIHQDFLKAVANLLQQETGIPTRKSTAP
jgi:hypothetical protein